MIISPVKFVVLFFSRHNSIFLSSEENVAYTTRKISNFISYNINNFNKNHCAEIKPLPINIDYCLFQFDALQYFLEVRLHAGSLPNFNFFNVNPQF